MEEVTITMVLNELKDFRAENNRRWEENEKRWEENEKRWEENDRRWQENEKRWEANNSRLEKIEKNVAENTKQIANLEKRVSENTEQINKLEEKVTDNTNRIINLEEGRKRDRKDILDVLDRMEKSISNKFSEMKEYMDAKFDKIYAAQIVNDIEHAEYRQIIHANSARLRFQDKRITDLESWKQDLEDGGCTIAAN